MTTLVCLGLGYCARHYVAEFGGRFTRIVGTTRSAEKAIALGLQQFSGRTVEMLVFDGASAPSNVADAIAESDALLISAAPADDVDPVLAAFEPTIVAASRLRSVVLLSTLGVYSDSQGAWVDETAEVIPGLARRGSARVDAERAWQAIGARQNLPVAVLRLGGIYGPGQNGMVRLLRGGVQRIAKRGHVSNRIHVHDIGQTIDACFNRHANGVFNVVDDEPAPPGDQIAFAAELLGLPPPPEISYEEAKKTASPFVLSFYDGCIRARNDKLKSALGVTLRYPNFRAGLRALHEAGD